MGTCTSTPNEEILKDNNLKPSIIEVKESDNETCDSISELSIELSKNVDIIDPLSSSLNRFRSIELNKNKMIVVDGNLYYTHTLKTSLSFNDVKSNFYFSDDLSDDDIKQFIPIINKNSISLTPSLKTRTPSITISSQSSIENNDQKHENNQNISRNNISHELNKETFLTHILTNIYYNWSVIFRAMMPQIINAMYKINILKGEYILNKKENIDLIYFVVNSGVFHVYQNNIKIENYQLIKYSTFGECHLIYNT
eukprot:311557_1